MIKNLGIRITDSMRTAPEYLHAKRLFVERQELQAKLREINRALRHLQGKAGSLVSLAKSDLDAEMRRSGYAISDHAA